MKLFDVIKLFSFDEECKIYTSDSEDEVQFKGFVTDIPYWLCECEIMEDGGIGVEDGELYFYVEV